MTAFVFIVTPTASFGQIEEQQQNTTDNNTSLNAITTATSNVTAITPTIELGEEPFAVGRYTLVSETMINETQQVQIILEGSTRIRLPNSMETITTRDTGEAIITFIPGGGVIRGQLQLATEDGSETVTAMLPNTFKVTLRQQSALYTLVQTLPECWHPLTIR